MILKIKSKMSSWAAKALSFAGRRVLLSSVISGIVNFWSASFILPKKAIQVINSLSSEFLWKGKIEGNNHARVAWNTLTLSKEEGGLGFHDIQSWNKASIIKLIWMLFFNPNSIWASWFITEILDGNVDNFWVINTRRRSHQSWLANKLLKLRDTVFPWIRRRVGNGERICFWTDNWSPLGSMRDYLLGQTQRSTGIRGDTVLAELWAEDRWILPPARSEQQVTVYSYLTTLTLTNEPDGYEWWINDSRSERYSTSEVYYLLKDHRPLVSWNQEVWNKAGIPKHQFLTWLVTLNRNPTMDRLLSWNLPVNPACCLCNNGEDSRNHLFFDCSYSWRIWDSTGRRCSASVFRDWTQNLTFLSSLPKSSPSSILLLIAWQASIYAIWTERNHRYHRNESKTVTILLRQIDLAIRNRASSLRCRRPRLASSLLQQWLGSAA